MQRDDFDVITFPTLGDLQSQATGALRVLIATEEIVGPVRNGGIASTYYHLARGLAADGHSVTICYLKGRQVENESVEHWIEHYAGFGIDFVPLPDVEEPIAGASAHWQSRWLSFYRWLKASSPFDVVHSSEWRGGAFYALQAKRLGLAFHETVFLTKTSSPYIWNRHYQMQPIDNVDLLIASYAEQKCVEWTDMVIGGSAHLLSFMDHIGYRLPEGRTYVQPNIVDFSEVIVEDVRPKRDYGDIVKTRELVFFGRLEPRKGLDLFVLAVDMLVAQGIAIDQITFLGKAGEPLSSFDGAQPLDFIRDHAEHWPFPVDIITDRNQPEALSLMCSRDMIAAMPSLIENSTMAVYEALVHKIPFVATDVGGTAELIDPSNHDATLVPPDIEELASRLESALKDGQPLAKPAFDNDANLATWYGFHRYLAAHKAPTATDTETSTADRICLVIHAPTVSALDQAIAQALSIDTLDHVLIYSAVPISDGARQKLDDLAADHVELVEAVGRATGACFNHAMDRTNAGIIMFQATDAIRFEPDFCDTLRVASMAQPDVLLTSLFRFSSDAEGAPDTIFAPLGGDMASQSLTGAAYGVEIIAGRKDLFAEIGQFEEYRVPKGTVHEYVSRAASQNRDLFVIPETLFSYAKDYATIIEQTGNAAYLMQKTMLDAVSLPAKKLLLHKPTAVRAPANSGRIMLGRAHREDGQTAWLTNVEKMGKLSDPPPNRHHVLLGFQRDSATLEFAVLHQGDLIIRANGKTIRQHEGFGQRNSFTTEEIELRPLLEDSDRLRLRIEFNRGNQLRFASILVQRIEEEIYFLSARSPIFWDGDFSKALGLIGGSLDIAPLPKLRRLPDANPSLLRRIRNR
ncbi:glycosyltransferase family 4 protein [Parasphingopyxis sp. CP4]|uniref:glycosyltransferase family 4 protein n=1 Tax=Parasphingopyxis sp. CP4 TaxID=2724527 RepID=UPI0015A0C451|nr:glycosyltransferase family 4 protein [Parasphingopyxis sp. CP4]QLC21323.1 glycosyltransferase family 4 protein [Parasphingopyxis sp. CP4]